MIQSAKDILSELNQIDEHHKLEAKKGFGDSAMETICAFSNTSNMGGGLLIIGVEKQGDTYVPVGVSDAEQISSDISTQCASMFNVPIRPQIRPDTIDGKNVLIVEVSESAPGTKLIYLERYGLPRGAFIRVGATDQRCTEEDLAILLGERAPESYDKTIVADANMDDIDPDAITYYRKLRRDVNPNATELAWTDEHLLESLFAIKRDNNGELKPTVAGILLFGSQFALRRLFPMARVDYMISPGKEWIEDPHNRFSTLIETREPLLRLAQRLYDQIYSNLPKAFSLKEGEIQAREETLPAIVIREVIVNALMHASYRTHQPIQIIQFSNRIEIHNAGYSLKNEDQLGEPGSKPRNPAIAGAFHETNLAETKGSGIYTMRRLMKENNFAPPDFKSNRDADLFIARLLLHHFLTEEDISWLNALKVDLNDAQSRCLIFVRETGAIDNSTYRQINDADTLTASNELRALRDKGLLTSEKQGKATYYTPGPKLKISPTDKEKQGEANTDMPEHIREKIVNLGTRPRKEKLQEVILELCEWRDLSAEEITKFLRRKDRKMLVRNSLTPLVESKKLVYTQPDMINHPDQKYRAANKK